MLRRSPSSIATLAVLLTLATVSELSVRPIRQAMAQSPAPFVVPDGTKLRVDSSPSMAAVNQTLKQKFESQYPGSTLELTERGTEAALKAVQEGRVDLAAIGRSLTPAEQAAGLVQTPVSRRKIAIVVGENNPFPGDMTGEQFAQIFRGEIVNWAEVGGANQRIRVLDRPNTDTRQALQPYPVFQGAPFQTGATADPVNNENVDAMIRQLGNDGISYAILDQVVNRPGVKLVTLYGTPPTDPSYPFSQPLTYVYRGANPSPAVQAFLGTATTPANQPALAPTPAANNPATSPSPAQPASPEAASGVASPNAAVPGNTTQAPQPASPNAAVAPVPSPAVAQAPSFDLGGGRVGVPWWLWLLSVPILGALLWALIRGLNSPESAAVATAAPVSPALLAADREGANSRIVLVPRSSQAAYAYWEVPEAHKQRIRKEEGGQKLALRLYDVTGLDFERHPAHSIEQFDCEEFTQDLHLPILQSNRDYVAELGYVTYQGRWVKLAQSKPVRISADAGGLNPEPGVEGGDMTTTAATMPILPNLPRSDEGFTGGTDVAAPFTQLEGDPAQGIVTGSTDPVRTVTPVSDSLSPAAGVALAGAGAAVAGASQRTQRVRRSQIVLVPRQDQDAYAYWEVLEHHKEIAKQHGGQSFILRICDVTGVVLEQQSPHSIQQFNCDETDCDRHVTVPDAGDYVAEIGYLAKNGRWLRIARSEAVKIPAPASDSFSAS